MITIRPAQTDADIAAARTLFREYADELQIDLCFQDFEMELAGLPGKYAAPQGRLLLAFDGVTPAGCVALRALDGQRCEMKRLYVRPGYRQHHLGRTLAERICEEAREGGYGRICLDTLPKLTQALALYRSLGFEPTQPYVYNPIEGALFLSLKL